MRPVPISNPPNPWATTEVEYLEGAPEVKLEVFEDQTRQILAKNDSPDVGFTLQRQPVPRLLPRLRLLLRAAVARVPELGRGDRLRSQDRRQAAGAASCCARRSRRRAGGKETVVFSGVTDCYQPLEASYRLTRGCLEVCVEHANPAAIITKSALIERDVDVLRRAGARRLGVRHGQHSVLGPGAGAGDRAVRRDAGAAAARHRDAGARRASRSA